MINTVTQLKNLVILLALMLISEHVISEDEIEELGRLFVDVEQREKLEAVRRGTYEKEVEQESRVSNVRINGVMMRSDGENVVWINGENTLDGEPVKGVKVNPDAADSETYNVHVQIDCKSIKLKPGQNWSEGTGTIKDNY
jgi:hypothetical protein